MVPGLPGAGLDDPDQEQGEPAEQDVGADAVLEAVEDGAQVDDVIMYRQAFSIAASCL